MYKYKKQRFDTKAIALSLIIRFYLMFSFYSISMGPLKIPNIECKVKSMYELPITRITHFGLNYQS